MVSEQIRLQVYMARCGVGSRRHCETYILEGRVTVNGITARLGTKVKSSDRVYFNKRQLSPETQKVYVAVNKPPGYLCANSDSRGRPLVLDLLQEVPVRLFHVGRLDLRSSGLIFYTNDGTFAKIVSHPSSRVEKEYIVEAKNPISEEVLAKYKRGLTISGEIYHLRKYRYKTPRKVILTLIEGKNREIRRVFQHFKVNLKRIHRVRIGCVEIRGIPSEGYRMLSRKEISWFINHGQGETGGRGD